MNNVYKSFDSSFYFFFFWERIHHSTLICNLFADLVFLYCWSMLNLLYGASNDQVQSRAALLFHFLFWGLQVGIWGFLFPFLFRAMFLAYFLLKFNKSVSLPTSGCC